MKILITGSNGFLGRNLVRFLQKQSPGYELIGVNRNPDKQLKQYYTLDLFNLSDVSKMLYETNPNVIVHLASMADPRPNYSKSCAMVNSNIISALNLAQEFRGEHFINLSTAVVYGNQPYPDETTKHDPISLYGITKATAESIIDLYQNNVCHLRPCAMIGPELTHGAVKDFIYKLKNENEFTAIGPAPGSIKPYIYIDDICKLIHTCIENKHCGVYNLGNNPISIEEVIRACMQTLCIYKPINWTNNNWAGDNKLLNINYSKVLKIWKPTYDSYGVVCKTVMAYT